MKLWLGISAIVAFVIGFGIYFGIIIWTKRYTKKYVEKAQREAIEQIRSLRNEIGILPFELENYFKNKVNAYDIEGIINTVFLNKYNSKLIIANNEEFSFACVSLKTNGETYYEVDEFDLEKYNKARLEKPELFPNQISMYQGQNIDFLGVFESKQSLDDLFNNYFDKLNENGMLAISLKKYSRKDLSNLLETLKHKKIQHEISYISTRFLFITNKKQ
ncbi:BC85_0335 family putative methyltransferase [Mycoplasmopsis edwardii]|nr:hypothetical protein [Mycoplasmopsis edwardii]